jgi:hypothetical protein
MAKQVSGREDDVFGLSLFGRNLQNLLLVVNDPKQVLVIPMDAMKQDPQRVMGNVMDHNPRQVMGNVMDHIGGHRMERVDAILTPTMERARAAMNTNSCLTKQKKSYKKYSLMT